MSKTAYKCVAVAALALGGLLALPAQAADLKCKMNFSMKGWSAIYQTASGYGTISCSNGARMRVKLSVKGGGLTVGKSSIDHGYGEFTGVHSINEVLGGYANANAHAGATKSVGAQVLTKGSVSLALSGKGRGWDLGVAFAGFTIERI
ncbi:hypothetical protein [Dyella sp.]|uniref:hypothetical protein n=1 Tax=Dyella sp. TaxID=1869338 RepID=UPI002ED50936